MPNTTVTVTSAAIAAGASLQATEAALVQMFCQQHSLHPAPGGVLAPLTDDTSDEVRTAAAALADLGNLSLDDLFAAADRAAADTGTDCFAVTVAVEWASLGLWPTPLADLSPLRLERVDKLAGLFGQH